MNKEILEKYKKSGRIAAEVREECKKIVKVGSRLIDVVEKIEELVKEKGADLAFPVNISLNEIGAHFTPTKNDEVKIKKDDVVKIDIGVHVDGYIGDTACTIVFNDKHRKLKECVEKALEEAIKLCKPNTSIRLIGATIEKTIREFGFKPVANLTGHGLERYNIHAEPTIPNVEISTRKVLIENQVIAIEPFATTGVGMVKESEPTVIFMIVEKGALRSETARKILSFAEKRKGLPFTLRWLPFNNISSRIAIREMLMKKLIYEFPVLKEVSNGLIAQAEHTIIVKTEPIITTKLED